MASKDLRLAWVLVFTGVSAACGVADDGSAPSLGEVQQGLFVSVPARIQAESYERANESTPSANSGTQCNRGDGVDMELTTDPNGGNCNVGWTAAGEWLEYDINVASAQTFTLTTRVASETAQSFHVNLDGTSLGTLTSPGTGWQSWADRNYTNVAIPAGNHTLRVVFDSGSVNLNYLELTSTGSSTCIEQALTRSAATASSQETAALGPALAIDGSTTTRWASAFADPQWITVDLGSKQRVSRVVLRWEAAYSRSYEIGVSDSASGPFTVVAGTSSSDGGTDEYSGLAATGRYVRMNSTARATAWGNSLYEFEVYGDPNPSCSTTTTPTCTDGVKNGNETGVDCGGSCPACPVTPTCTDGVKNGSETGVDCGGSCPACPTTCQEAALARSSATASSSENASYPASLAIDSSTTTRWASAFADPQWITVDLGATKKVSRVVLSWEAAYSKSYEIAVSDNADSGPWTTLYSTTNSDGGTDDLRNLSGRGRYVRMYSLARATAWGNSLYDFQIYGDSNASCSSACVNSEVTNSTSLSLKRSDVGARQLVGGITQGARLARDPISGKLHLMTVGGTISRLDVWPGNFSTLTQVVSASQITSGMNVTPSTFQGMAFAPNGDIYVVLNVDGGTTNRAYVRRGTGSGSRTWTTFASTDPYPDSNTPFDHHFSGVVVSPDGTSVYVTSGSRTDHGEIQDTGGAFPGTREVPLTAAMFKLPASGSNLVLKNDTAALTSAGYLFATGLRNTFDPTFGPSNEIFAGDNGPDADYSEELNVVRAGQHYGFPWRLGGENNAQQFSSYNPATDSRLHAGFHAVDNGAYHNDPTFPAAPSGMVDPLLNKGPDADLFRDVVTGGVVDASASGRAINTFTGHRVPVGLTFDLGGSLCGADFQNKAFVLSWGAAVQVFTDKGEDLLLLNLISTSGGGYE
ncbi:MAG TPA: discoidin domain-containing protein, partial [Polyangiaceae bacterium]|nr:discoidin domain-containing protein [Polyangiaceae bacterium]